MYRIKLIYGGIRGYTGKNKSIWIVTKDYLIKTLINPLRKYSKFD